jgi:hypothetical protein
VAGRAAPLAAAAAAQPKHERWRHYERINDGIGFLDRSMGGSTSGLTGTLGGSDSSAGSATGSGFSTGSMGGSTVARAECPAVSGSEGSSDFLDWFHGRRHKWRKDIDAAMYRWSSASD